jgi:hypothetical protein
MRRAEGKTSARASTALRVSGRCLGQVPSGPTRLDPTPGWVSRDRASGKAYPVVPTNLPLAYSDTVAENVLPASAVEPVP